MKVRKIKKSKKINYAVTNSRSLIPKIDSMVDYFDEHDLIFMIITETWLKNNEATNIIVEDVREGSSVELIRKDRSGRRGGGVAIAFDNRKASFKKYNIPGAIHEIV